MSISLIVPVYNKATFLKRCFDSIAQQTSNQFQVIVVDDGSTDGSTKICAEYCEKYGWDLHCTQNRGVSEARNLGVDRASGDYITFLDADDVLIPQAAETMAKAAKRGENIIQFGQFRIRHLEDYIARLQYPYTASEKFYDLTYIPKYWVMVWNKLYKASFLKDHNIRFRPGMQFGEDTVFNMECILANGGLYHAELPTVIHCLEDTNSLCRGHLTLDRILKLDQEMLAIAYQQTDEKKIEWANTAINEHRKSKLFKKYGADRGELGRYDIVYLVKDAPDNDELVYSLRSVEANFKYRNVWFYGGCPTNLKPDRKVRVAQLGLNKWEKVRNMLRQVCMNNEITDDFWLFNDDFFILKEIDESIPPQLNGKLIPYVERIEKRNGTADDYTLRLREAAAELERHGLDTLNYEVHKPMLINRKKALEILDKFPNTPAFRSLYGNYWKIGGESKHDMKIKIVKFSRLSEVENFWDFVSTSDDSFRDGEIGRFLKSRFDKKSRFERS